MITYVSFLIILPEFRRGQATHLAALYLPDERTIKLTFENTHISLSESVFSLSILRVMFVLYAYK